MSKKLLFCLHASDLEKVASGKVLAGTALGAFGMNKLFGHRSGTAGNNTPLNAAIGAGGGAAWGAQNFARAAKMGKGSGKTRLATMGLGALTGASGMVLGGAAA